MKQVNVGGVKIGGGAPISIQSMTNTRAADITATIEQINELEQAGCDIVRFAVPDMECARAVSVIKERTNVPLVADIHFDYRLALECINRGIDKVRINPGNIGGEERAKIVADAAKRHGVPIRIGVNGGSLEAEFKGLPLAEAMIKSAQRHIEILHRCDFDDIVVSLKSSDVKTTIKAYRLAYEQFGCPLHIGVTEAGGAAEGIIKSSIGIGALLADGIGDTIRVSLTDNPLFEVKTAKSILKILGIRTGVEVISCPTCGRTQINLIPIAHMVSEAVQDIDKNIKVAVMGCVVNGPGEAADADIGIAGGDGCAVLFKKGKIVGKIREDEIVDRLLKEIENID